MGSKAHDLSTHEIAMRALLLIQAHRVPLLQSEYADLIRERFWVSRAQSNRLARKAMDVLCIPPLPLEERNRRLELRGARCLSYRREEAA